MSNKYAGITALQTFLDNLKNLFATKTEVGGKADSDHKHEIADVNNLQTTLDSKSDTTHNHDGVYDAKGSADTALESAKSYTDEEVSNLASTVAYIDETDNETVVLSVDLDVLSSLVGGDA